MSFFGLRFGSNDDDSLFGGFGRDFIFGRGGNDDIGGGAGRDLLFGGSGNDTVDGGRGRDFIDGGEGQDELTGGKGRDTFFFGDNRLPEEANTEGRDIVGGEDTITDFQQGRDTMLLDTDAFTVDGPFQFQNALAEDLVDDGSNLIVLQNSDNDGNPATPFLAGTAAGLIAEQIDTSGAGFFVYFNSNLQLNRLVYSEDLSDATADLQIINRLTDVTGEDAIAALETFSEGDFAFLDGLDLV
ncbi:MAG: hypothetical protein AAFP17_04410 [Pseudomonadota bacterium]